MVLRLLGGIGLIASGAVALIDWSERHACKVRGYSERYSPSADSRIRSYRQHEKRKTRNEAIRATHQIQNQVIRAEVQKQYTTLKLLQKTCRNFKTQRRCLSESIHSLAARCTSLYVKAREVHDRLSRDDLHLRIRELKQEKEKLLQFRQDADVEIQNLYQQIREVKEIIRNVQAQRGR